MCRFAPIVLFTFKRLETLRKTVEALAHNFLAAESDLIIYSDAAKEEKDKGTIDSVRLYLKSITGFKSVTIIESNVNKGLAASIIHGVSEVISKYGRAIVLEDDLITSKNFLNFMNAGLEKYELTKKVYSISGYAFDIVKDSSSLDGYFLNRSTSWGWATWEDRWNKIDWDVKDFGKFMNDRELQRQFEQLGSDVTGMLKKQMQGLRDSWYIRSIFHQSNIKGLSVYPSVSKIDNNGFDLLATHNKGLKDRYVTSFDSSDKIIFNLPDKIEIDKYYQTEYLKKFSIRTRLLNKVKELFT
jgi:hypothetical protein